MGPFGSLYGPMAHFGHGALNKRAYLAEFGIWLISSIIFLAPIAYLQACVALRAHVSAASPTMGVIWVFAANLIKQARPQTSLNTALEP